MPQTDHNPLKHSHYRTVRGIRQKSCPCCSQRAGRRVYWNMEAFGDRQVGEEAITQSWCMACRTAAKRKEA